MGGASGGNLAKSPYRILSRCWHEIPNSLHFSSVLLALCEALKEHCPPRQRSSVVLLKATVEPLSNDVTVDNECGHPQRAEGGRARNIVKWGGRRAET